MKHIAMKIPREGIKNITAKESESDGQKLDPGKQRILKNSGKLLEFLQDFLPPKKNAEKGVK